MLETKSVRAFGHADESGRASGSDALSDEWDLSRVLAFFRRRRLAVIAGILGTVAVAVFYIAVTVPRYTAVVDILLETPKLKAVADPYDNGASSLDTNAVDSQVELLKSERLALRVLTKLNLKQNAAFAPSESPIGALMGSASSAIGRFLGLRDEAYEAARAEERGRLLERRIIGLLSDNLSVKRVAKTFVIEVSFTDPDVKLATNIANSYANEYLADEYDAKYDATTRAAVWLQDRIIELREKSIAADTDVQKFRAANGLISVDGKLVNEDQLGNANRQLSDARAKLADSEARIQRIDSIQTEGMIDAAVVESLANPVVANLRTKFLETARREAEIAKRLGPDHIATVNLRSEMNQYQQQLFAELKRIGESYRSDFQIAKARVEALEENYRKAVDLIAGDNQTAVRLRELEREAETYKSLYQNFLARYQEAIQHQSFPVNDARIISVAIPPLSPSWPKKALILAIALVLGSGVGVGLALVFELRDRVYRTGDQVQHDLGLDFLGLLPLVNASRIRPNGATTANRLLEAEQMAPIMRYALVNPLSGYAETLRATKVAADIALRGKPSKVIGIISILPDEGKTTFAKNFASLIAHLGSKTILIDADMRNPGLSRSIAPDASVGLREVLIGKTYLTQAQLQEPETSLSVVPNVLDRQSANSAELLSSMAMEKFVSHLAESHSYIVIDLPPIGPVVDVRAMAGIVDAFVLVVEWGVTPREIVRATLEADQEIRNKCVGVILNKVNMDAMKKYDGSGYRNYHYYSGYGKYFSG